MSSDVIKPVFLVDAAADPVAIRIEGRASFQNSGCLAEFFKEIIAQGKSRVKIDFERCSSMDSTFLGVLAGAALQLRKLSPPGSLVLTRVGPRNLELVRNLGLHRILTVDTGTEAAAAPGSSARLLTCAPKPELENARLVLEAHENLVSADAANHEKFEDVMSFLRKQIGKKTEPGATS